HRAYPLRGDVAQALAEAEQALERALAHLGMQPALRVEALGQAHHLAQAVDDAELAEDVARNDHVEAVGAQVDRRQQVAVLQRQRLRAQVQVRALVHSWPPATACSKVSWAECGASPGAGVART